MEALQDKVARAFHADFILEGTRGQSLPSVNDLAEKYGVSVGLARKFYQTLRDEGVIRAERRKGYFLQAPERFHLQGHSRELLIGVVGYIHEQHIAASYCTAALIMQALERLATGRGWRVLFFNTWPSLSMTRDVLMKVAQAKLDAVFVTTKVEKEEIESLRLLEIPVLVREQPYEGTTCITFDNREIGRCATTHLLERGHRKIAYVAPDTPYNWSEQRQLGFFEALDKANPPPAVGGVFPCDLTDLEANRQLVATLQAEGFTAVFCANDHLAMALIQAGLNQKDIAIIGVDDSVESKSRDISTIQKSADVLGEIAYKVLAEHFDHGTPLPALAQHKSILLKRGSTSRAI
jgi:LacI family transcriptional regulator